MNGVRFRYHVQCPAEDGREAMTLHPVPEDGAFSPASLGRFVQ